MLVFLYLVLVKSYHGQKHDLFWRQNIYNLRKSFILYGHTYCSITISIQEFQYYKVNIQVPHLYISTEHSKEDELPKFRSYQNVFNNTAIISFSPSVSTDPVFLNTQPVDTSEDGLQIISGFTTPWFTIHIVTLTFGRSSSNRLPMWCLVLKLKDILRWNLLFCLIFQLECIYMLLLK